MIAFHPFESAENALENINAITDHELTDDLRVFTNNDLSFVEIEVMIFVLKSLKINRTSSKARFPRERNHRNFRLEWYS